MSADQIDLAANQPSGAAMATPKKSEAAVGVELGIGPLIPNSSYDTWMGTDENGTVIANTRQLVSLDELILMRRKDGQARALMRLFTLPIRLAFASGEWVEPDHMEGKGEKEAEYANQMWTLPPYAGGMDTPSSKFLREALLGLSDGFAIFEEVRKIPKSGPLKGKIVLSKMGYRDPRTTKFVVDERGEWTGVRQQVSLQGTARDVTIDRSKVWYYAAQEEENPYYGVSLLESPWHHYDVKRKMYYIAYIAAQFAAVPGRLGTAPRNPDPATFAQFKAGLQNFAFNTAMTMPEGYTVTPFNGNSGFNFLEHINHQNLMMAQSLLAGFLNTAERQVLIDNNSNDSASDMFVMSIEAVMREIEQKLSYELMPKYILWNFNSYASPMFKFGQLTDSSRDAIKEVFTTVVNSSVLNCTPEFVRETEIKLAKRLGYDIDYEEIEAEEEKNRIENEKAAAQAEADAEFEQAQAAGGEQQSPIQAQRQAPEVTGQGGEFKPKDQIGASARAGLYGIDDLVEMAAELLATSTESE